MTRRQRLMALGAIIAICGGAAALSQTGHPANAVATARHDPGQSAVPFTLFRDQRIMLEARSTGGRR